MMGSVACDKQPPAVVCKTEIAGRCFVILDPECWVWDFKLRAYYIIFIFVYYYSVFL